MSNSLVWLNGESYEFETAHVLGKDLREIFGLDDEQELWMTNAFDDELIENGRVIILYSGIDFSTK